MDQKRISNMLYAAKAIALVLIVWAHMPTDGQLSGQALFEGLRTSIVQPSILVFFFISGYFYKRSPGDSKSFWSKKTKSLLIPWLVWATATFVLSLILSGSLNGLFASWLKWVLGIGSVYWYMSVITVCLVLFKAVTLNEKTMDTLLWICVGISAISVILSVCSVIEYNLQWNQYTNAFNWVGVFAFGILARRKNWLEWMTSAKAAIVSSVILTVCLVLSAARGIQVNTFIDIYSIPIEIFGTVCILFLAKLLAKSKLVVDIGRKSFFVYLIHIQIAGILNSQLPHTVLFYVLRPFAALAVCYLLAKLFRWVLQKLKWYDKIGVYFALR